MVFGIGVAHQDDCTANLKKTERRTNKNQVSKGSTGWMQVFAGLNEARRALKFRVLALTVECLVFSGGWDLGFTASVQCLVLWASTVRMTCSATKTRV